MNADKTADKIRLSNSSEKSSVTAQKRHQEQHQKNFFFPVHFYDAGRDARRDAGLDAHLQAPRVFLMGLSLFLICHAVLWCMQTCSDRFYRHSGW